MSDSRDLPPSNLLLDVENPRRDPTTDQRDAIQTLVREQGQKLLNLATDVVEKGLDPSQSFIVLEQKNPATKAQEFVVLEGNRRLAALKVLEVPTLLASDTPAPLAAAFRKLSQKYKLPATVPCAVVSDREEARHWLELRHTGENEGIGVVQWGAIEKARFNALVGKRFFAFSESSAASPLRRRRA
jgi:hypothetical protein